MASELGVAYVSVVPSAKGFSSTLGKQVNGKMAGVGKSAGSKLGGAITSAARKAAKYGAVAAGVAVGAAVVGGVKSAIDQQKSEKTLAGLYDSADAAKGIMKDLRKVSKDSSLDYSSYTKTAETLAYMGVEGKEVGPMLQNMGKAIVGAGGTSADLERAGDAMLKMVNSGKVYAADLNQLSQTGIPVVSALATKMFGDSSAESIAAMREAVSAGKVSVEDVQEVMADATGKNFKAQMRASEGIEKTWSATWKRTKDNVLTSLGAILVPLLEKITPGLEKAGEKMSAFIEGLQSGTGAGGRFANQVRDISSALAPLLSIVGKVIKFFATHLRLTTALVAIFAAYKLGVLGVAAAQRAVAVATTAWTTAQWLLNAAMSANPIGIVIVGLTALAGALVLAYQKSETFRTIVNNMFMVLKMVALGVVNWFKESFIPFFTQTIPAAFRTVLNWLGENWPTILAILTGPIGIAVLTIVRHKDKIVGAFKALVGYVRGGLATAFIWLRDTIVRPIMSAISSVISGVWHNGINPIFTAIKSGVRAVGNVFKTVRDKISDIWGGMKRIITNPLNAGRKAINKFLGVVSKVPGLGFVADYKIKKPKGWATGGWTGPGSRNQPAGVVHADEHVMSKPARRALEAANPGGLDYMNRTGRWPGYKRGGIVRPLRPMPVASGQYPGHTGIDYPVSIGTPVHAPEDSRVTAANKWNYSYGHHYRLKGLQTGMSIILAHLSKMYRGVGHEFKAGDIVGKSGSTGNSTGPHLHFEVRPGGNPAAAQQYLAGAKQAPGGGGGGLISWLTSAGSFVKKFKGYFDGTNKGLLSEGGGLAGWAGETGKEWFKYLKDKALDALKSVGSYLGKGFKGLLPGNVLKWGDKVYKALGKTGLPQNQSYMEAWLKQIDTESGGNAKARQKVWDINMATGQPARGLLQTVPGTFSSYFMKGHSNIWNGYDNMLAAMQYAKSRYGKEGMLNVIGKGHGYAGGTFGASPGWRWVGERGPELMRFRGGERVMSNQRARQTSAPATSGPLDLSDASIDRLAAQLATYGTDVAVAATTAGIDRFDRRTERRQRLEVR